MVWLICKDDGAGTKRSSMHLLQTVSKRNFIGLFQADASSKYRLYIFVSDQLRE